MRQPDGALHVDDAEFATIRSPLCLCVMGAGFSIKVVCPRKARAASTFTTIHVYIESVLIDIPYSASARNMIF